MTVFNALLFPTSNLEVLGQEYFYSLDFDKVGKYDWCRAAMDYFTEKVPKFQTSNKKSTPAIQGCIVVPLIYYLDSLSFPPHSLSDVSSRPRAACFHGAVVDTLINADRIVSRDGKKTYGKLPWQDKDMICYEKITDSSNTNIPVEQELFGDQQGGTSAPVSTTGGQINDGDNQQPSQAQELDFSSNSLYLKPLFQDILADASDEDKRDQIMLAIEHHDKMMDGAVANVERGERMVSEAKSMILEANSKIVTGEKLVSEGKALMKDAHLKLVAEVRKIIAPSAPLLEHPVQGTVNAGGSSSLQSSPVGADGFSPLHSPAGVDGSSPPHTLAGADDSPPPHSPPAGADEVIGQDDVSKTADVEMPAEIFHQEPIGQDNVSKTAEVEMPACNDASVIPPETGPNEQTAQGGVANPAEGEKPVDNDASTTLPEIGPLNEPTVQDDASKAAEGEKPADNDAWMTQPETGPLSAPDNSLGGVHVNSFDWGGWGSITSVLRDIDDNYSAPGLASNDDMPHIEAEVHEDQNLRDNVAMPEANERDAVKSYARKNKGRKKNKGVSLLFQIPLELGFPVVQFQRAKGVTTRSSKFTSPFKAPMVRRDAPDVEKSMKLRGLLSLAALMSLEKN